MNPMNSLLDVVEDLSRHNLPAPLSPSVRTMSDRGSSCGSSFASRVVDKETSSTPPPTATSPAATPNEPSLPLAAELGLSLAQTGPWTPFTALPLTAAGRELSKKRYFYCVRAQAILSDYSLYPRVEEQRRISPDARFYRVWRYCAFCKADVVVGSTAEEMDGSTIQAARHPTVPTSLEGLEAEMKAGFPSFPGAGARGPPGLEVLSSVDRVGRPTKTPVFNDPTSYRWSEGERAAKNRRKKEQKERAMLTKALVLYEEDTGIRLSLEAVLEARALNS